MEAGAVYVTAQCVKVWPLRTQLALLRVPCPPLDPVGVLASA